MLISTIVRWEGSVIRVSKSTRISFYFSWSKESLLNLVSSKGKIGSDLGFIEKYLCLLVFSIKRCMEETLSHLSQTLVLFETPITFQIPSQLPDPAQEVANIWITKGLTSEIPIWIAGKHVEIRKLWQVDYWESRL